MSGSRDVFVYSPSLWRSLAKRAPRAAWTHASDMRMIAPRNALVAQLDRVLPSEGRGRGFESRRVRHLAAFLHSSGDGETQHEARHLRALSFLALAQFCAERSIRCGLVSPASRIQHLHFISLAVFSDIAAPLLYKKMRRVTYARDGSFKPIVQLRKFSRRFGLGPSNR